MLQVGVVSQIFPYDLETTAKRIRAHGFNTVQVQPDFVDAGSESEPLTSEECRRIGEVFRRHDLAIAAVSGYQNIVHPDRSERASRLSDLEHLLRHARDFGTPYVVSGTGGYHPENQWAPHARNTSEDGYNECVDVVGQLTRVAESADAVFLIEPYVNNVINSVDRVVRLFQDVASPALGLLMDPANYFDESNLDDMDAVLESIFSELGAYVRVAHAKDVRRGSAGMELPGPGDGALNYDLFLSLLSASHPNAPLMVEHIEEDGVTAAKTFVVNRLVSLAV